MMNKSVNDLDDNTNRLDDTNLLLDKSSVGALDLVPPAPKIEGTISFVRDDELSLQQFGRDVTITKPNIDVALRIKLIDVEIERLLHEKRQLIRQATTGKLVWSN